MNEPNLVRRLTTIVAVDVVGFSTMSARDEEHALELLGQRMATTGSIVKHHRGRVFKATGDGLLAEFASPVEAVRAALETQEAMRSANASVRPDDQLTLRIGVNLGDVVESGDDLMGDAVNVAVRLESIAPHGGICVSSSIYEQIVGKLTLGAEDMGEQHVKNIPRPIHAYRLTLEGAPPRAPPAKAASATTARAGSTLLVAVGSIAAAAVVAAGVGAWLMHDRMEPAPPAAVQAPARSASPTQVATAAPAPTPANPPSPVPVAPTAPSPVGSTPSNVPATAPAPSPPVAATRPYVAAEVPFVGDFRRRALENYARAEGSKAMAITVRGHLAIATRRIDDAAARRVALEECNKGVKREVPQPREADRCMIYAIGNDVVWTFRLPPLPPPPYLPPTRPSPPITFDPAAVPLIREPARLHLAEHYVTSERKRALVLGRNRVEWWSPSETERDAIRRNLQICGHITGRPCIVYSVDVQVVVRAPQRYRIVDVLTPPDLADLNAGQQVAIDRYLVADDWRAIALGRNGRLGMATRQPSETDAVNDALRACAQAGGTECAVAAVGPFLVAPK
ncbi:MAG: adenylate/guanylate cyclase domain-containing protein [Reyranella sp.]|uniref:adenylate/guanylate cyclase domain-containing protein n=1 Tax=Reyranella sp. TaxID=1929291 RepID=UPI003D12DF35